MTNNNIKDLYDVAAELSRIDKQLFSILSYIYEHPINDKAFYELKWNTDTASNFISKAFEAANKSIDINF